MYNFDYVGKRCGAVFEGHESGYQVSLDGKQRFTFDKFLDTFVLIENYRHPFTITTTAKRQKRLDKKLENLGYVSVVLKQIDFDFKEENAFLYGYYQVNLPNPFRQRKRVCC